MTEFVQYVVNGLASGSLYVLLAVGFTLVFGVMGMMNVAHADLYMIAVFTLLWVGQNSGAGNLVGFIAGVVAAVATGFLVFVIVLRKVDKTVPLALFVGTLGVSYFIENLVAKIVEFRARSVRPVLPDPPVALGGVRISNSDLLIFGATLVISLGLLWWLKSSTTGRLMRAVLGEPVAVGGGGDQHHQDHGHRRDHRLGDRRHRRAADGQQDPGDQPVRGQRRVAEDVRRRRGRRHRQRRRRADRRPGARGDRVVDGRRTSARRGRTSSAWRR